MIMRTLQRGVAEQLARALDMDLAKIKASTNLLEGIHSDAVEFLKDKAITASALRLLRKVKVVRQIDMAQMIVSANNYTRSFAEALLVGTSADQFTAGSQPPEEIARMQNEMESLERD